MEADKINRWLTLATNLAAVLGISFLVIGVQQNTAAIRGQASIAVNDSLANLDSAIYADAEFTDIWIRGRGRGIYRYLDSRTRVIGQPRSCGA